MEIVTENTFRGWAINELDFSERPRVQIWSNGELYGETVAEIFRKDLLENNLGDGRFGFEYPNNFDFCLSSATGQNVELVVLSKTGEQTPASVLDDAFDSIKFKIAIPDLTHVLPSMIGSGFFLDNVRNFNRVLTLDPDLYPLNASGREIIALRMYSYGDQMWWTPECDGSPSAMQFFSHVGPRCKERLAKGAAKILFDMSNEGPPVVPNAPWLSVLHDEVRKLGIDPASCVIMNHNHSFHNDYLLWCKENNEQSPMGVVNYHYFLSKFAHLAAAQPFVPLAAEPLINDCAEFKSFICLKFTPRPDRLAFLAWLFGAGLAEYGFISFAGLSNHKLDASDSLLPDWLPEMDIVKTGMKHLKTVGPLLLDRPGQGTNTHAVDGNNALAFELGPEHCYHRSFFSIVTETDFLDSSVHRITEKSLKPLAMGHPIIIYGNPHSLERLRELGFRTFNPFIDETYDTIDDRHDRMTRVQAEVRRLVGMSPAELLELRAKLRRVIEHNYRHARGGLSDLYRSIIEPGILHQLDRLPWRALA